MMVAPPCLSQRLSDLSKHHNTWRAFEAQAALSLTPAPGVSDSMGLEWGLRFAFLPFALVAAESGAPL